VRCLRGTHLSVNLEATSVFSVPHLSEFPFDSFDFLISDLASFFFLRTIASMHIDSLPFLFRAPAGDLFFLLAPLFLFHPQRVFSCQALSFNFGAACLFISPQARQLTFELRDLFGDARGDRMIFIRHGRRSGRNGRYGRYSRHNRSDRRRHLGRQVSGGRRFNGGLFIENCQKLCLVRAQRAAQVFCDGALRRVNYQPAIAGRAYFNAFSAQFRKQFMGRHISITSRSFSIDWGDG
jgi:hypothetical protein